MDCSTPGFPVHHQLLELLKLMSIMSVISSNQLILCSPFLPIFNHSSIRVFSNDSALHVRWPKYWSFNFSINPSSEYSVLTSFDFLDWFDFLAVQRTLKSLLNHHISKASVLQLSVFFAVQLSHPYMTTGKTIALTVHILVSKVMSLLFNMLSRLVVIFSSKEQASFNFVAAITIHSDFAAQEKKICHCSHFFPFYLP